MKIVGIIEDNGITGVKYGLIEVPDVIISTEQPPVPHAHNKSPKAAPVRAKQIRNKHCTYNQTAYKNKHQGAATTPQATATRAYNQTQKIASARAKQVNKNRGAKHK